MIRQPAVAGQFYPRQKEELEEVMVLYRKEVGLTSEKKIESKGLILPHAGYMYCGRVVAETIFSSSVKNTLIILGPNHTGLGDPLSVMTRGSWQTPMGSVDIDSSLSEEIVRNSTFLTEDTIAHTYEHSIEVLLPFLQFEKDSFKIVPIVVAPSTINIYKKVGEEIYQSMKVKRKDRNVSILASSDMTHYESSSSAHHKDHCAIDAIIRLDVDGLLEQVKKLDISMCGVGPVVIMLEVVKRMGANRAELVKYQTSGDITGDNRSVVGYAGVRIN